jgi:hypothetical protein
MFNRMLLPSGTSLICLAMLPLNRIHFYCIASPQIIKIIFAVRDKWDFRH